MSYSPSFNYVPNHIFINNNNNNNHLNTNIKLKDNLVIDINDYSKVKKLGGGAFGDVYLVENKNTHKMYAAKETKNNQTYEIADLINEIKIISEYNNPTIVKIHGYSLVNFKNQPYPVMLLEYMKNGSLESVLKRCRKETEKEFRNQFKSKRYIILYGLAVSLCFLHSKCIIHRDIKPANILLDENFYPGISDFGTVLFPSQQLLKKQTDEEVGTPYYLAPEIILRNEKYSYKTDIYAFGLIAYELLTGYEPFPNYKRTSLLYNAIRRGERPRLTMVSDSEMRFFLQRCWSNEPSERPSAVEIVNLMMKPQFRAVFGSNDLEFVKYSYTLMQNENYSDLIDKGHMESLRYMLGLGVEQNNEKAFEILNKLQPNRDSNTYYLLSLQYEMRNDLEKSAYYCKIAADQDNVNAIINMGDKYLKGFGVPVDFVKSCYYYKKAAKLKSPFGMFNYATMLYNGRGVPVNYKKAAKYYEMSADLGNVNGMYSIARMYDIGDKIPPNYPKAAYYYKKAAAQGDTEAMWNLGLMESSGRIPKDFKSDDHYLKMSVNKGGDKEKVIYASSLCYDVLYGNLDKKEKEKKIKKAASYFKQAAQNGNIEAMVQYGSMFTCGLLDNDDIDEAIKYSKIAAEDKTVLGMINCGFLLIQKDKDDIENIKEALKYFQMAVDYKYDYAISLVKVLKAYLSVPRRQKLSKHFYDGFGSDLLEVDNQNAKKEEEDNESKQKNAENKEIVSDKNVYNEVNCGKHKIDGNNNNCNNNNNNNYNNNNNNDNYNSNKYNNCNSSNNNNSNYNNNNNNNYNSNNSNDNYNNNNNSDYNNSNSNDNYNNNKYNNYNSNNNNYNNSNNSNYNNNNNSNYNNSNNSNDNHNNNNNNYNNSNNSNSNYNNNNNSNYNSNDNSNYQNNVSNINHNNANSNDNNYNNYQNNNNSNDKKCNINSSNTKDNPNSNNKSNQRIDNQMKNKKEETKKCKNDHNNEVSKNNKTNVIDDSNQKIDHSNDAIYKVKVNIYQSFKFETNDFICFSQSTIPEVIQREIEAYLKLYPCFTDKKKNICYPNDPNSFFTFYFYSKLNFDYNSIINGLKQIFQKYRIDFYHPKFYSDIYFDETMFPKDELKLFINHLKRIPGMNDVRQNIFDGKQISTYLVVEEGYHKSIIESIKNLLMPKNIIFNTVNYPLKSNIIINEKMVLQNETDFETIVKEIESISIKPIFIERNKLFLYGDYPMRKIFQTFSFICFQNEVLKMVALNHINALIYKGKENVLEYDLDLYYASINENCYPKRISDYIPKIFESLKGFKEIQRSVLSIESPVERTYVGFDSIKHLKKAYSKFKNRLNVLLHFQKPKLFLKKNNYQYFYINGNHNFLIDSIIMLLSKSALDIQAYCNEVDDSKGVSVEIYRSYFGFETFDDLQASIVYLTEYFGPKLQTIGIKFYKSGKGYINVTLDSQVSYLYYDNL